MEGFNPNSPEAMAYHDKIRESQYSWQVSKETPEIYGSMLFPQDCGAPVQAKTHA